MNLKEIEKVVGVIQSHIFKNSNSFSAGVLKSQFRGSGLQFREHQVYVPGDDVRFIDWKLSAKSSNVYVKTFEEERNVEINVYLDFSYTLFYGHQKISKLQCIIEIIALLYLLAGQTNDLVRVVIWKEKSIVLPPKSGREGLTLLTSVLEELKLLDENGSVPVHPLPFGELVSEKKKMTDIKGSLMRRKEVIYLGDLSLLTKKDDWQKLFSKKNMHAFKILSPVDTFDKFPFLMKFAGQTERKNQVTLSSSRSRQKMEESLGRIKEIGVHERYLEKFIKELL